VIADSDRVVGQVEGRGAEAVIKPNPCRKTPREIDAHLGRERNVVERFWNKAKHDRRVATRYEKKARDFLAFVQVAAMMIMVQ
jgi:transposase